eukprot:NODE_97_length_21155_cov_0.234850.p18 type:complete len:121 gc:universal NODE_97_length_21155_cov_0.234850:11140-11502(+)
MPRKRHLVRKHFDIIKRSPTKEKGVCKYCKIQIGFSVLRGKQHLKKCWKCPPEVLREVSESESHCTEINTSFNEWISTYKIPFDVINTEKFRDFIAQLNENWELPKQKHCVDISIQNLIN